MRVAVRAGCISWWCTGQDQLSDSCSRKSEVHRAEKARLLLLDQGTLVWRLEDILDPATLYMFSSYYTQYVQQNAFTNTVTVATSGQQFAMLRPCGQLPPREL